MGIFVAVPNPPSKKNHRVRCRVISSERARKLHNSELIALVDINFPPFRLKIFYLCGLQTRKCFQCTYQISEVVILPLRTGAQCLPDNRYRYLG